MNVDDGRIMRSWHSCLFYHILHTGIEFDSAFLADLSTHKIEAKVFKKLSVKF